MAVMEDGFTFQKGWRARQEAGRERLKHKLATSDVRAQRRALIEALDAEAKVEAEVDLDAAAAEAARAANEAALAADAKAKAEADQTLPLWPRLLTTQPRRPRARRPPRSPLWPSSCRQGR
jgi:hypothetical protein